MADNGQGAGGNERRGILKRLQEGKWPFLLLAAAFALAAYIIGYGLMNPPA